VLAKDLTFEGSFSFFKSFTDAPNPSLHLDQVGTIGLPLSSRDADVIKAHSVQAPFGKGERTLVDKDVRDTWEIDCSLVRCENPEWEKFLDRVVGEVCTALGVNREASQPRAAPYKLLLYEEGCQ
jgi:hypothetical protein